MTVELAAFIGFVGLPLACIALERAWPSRHPHPVLRRGAASDALWYVVQAYVANGLAPWAVYFALVPLLLVLGTSTAVLPGGFGPVSAIPFWWQVPIVLVLADFLSYWQHRLFHGRWLWRVHAVHHSSSQLDWLSSGRFHPLNEVGVQIVNVTPVLACGFDPAAFLVVAPFVAWYVVLLHANLDWSYGPLRAVIASPVFHRWHHTRAEEGRDKNFAGLFPVWDVVFGTFYMPEGRVPADFGTADPVPDGFLGQLAYPLWRRRSARVGRNAASEEPRP
jgi:sterol desaturase/sphingolipid hydroxylase (fatty acid hydroxylase superfamily)